MEEKKNVRSKKVAVNSSTGAKKVEEIEKRATHVRGEKENQATKSIQKKVAKEQDNAKKRVAAAKRRAEKKEQRHQKRSRRMQEWRERRLQAKERAKERKAQAKERAKERRLARAARKDMLKNETAVERSQRKERERAEKIALRKQNKQLRHELALKRKENRIRKRELAAQERRHKREQKTERRKHAPGFGGWLAAVISLGVVSLAMLSVITVGAVNMMGLNDVVTSSYRSGLYEMTELSETLSGDLNKLRVATGGEEQRALLTNILVESELLESALEKFPVEQVTTNNISSFLNKASAYAREGLNKIAKNGELGMETEASVEYMYETNQAILKELQSLRNTMTDSEWNKLMKDSQNGMAGQSFNNVNNNVIKTPSTIQDGPFSENKKRVSALGLENLPDVSVSKATVLVREYFSDYDLDTVDYKGETMAENITCYNFTLKDNRGREMYAQLSKAGGKLIMFSSYEKCSANNFDKQACIDIAKQFLNDLGMTDMTPVWLQENGTAANINFVYSQDDTVCYSDMVIVKVCETKGKVIGLEAMPYFLNHGERSIAKAEISEEQAAQALGRLQPATARLALIPFGGEERLTYEFTGTYKGQRFFAYVDAQTGEEIENFTVLNTKQGEVVE